MCRPDRLGRAAGKEPSMVPVVDADPLKPSSLPTPDSYEFFTMWEKNSNWKNNVTLKRLVGQLSTINQTPRTIPINTNRILQRRAPPLQRPLPHDLEDLSYAFTHDDSAE